MKNSNAYHYYKLAYFVSIQLCFLLLILSFSNLVRAEKRAALPNTRNSLQQRNQPGYMYLTCPETTLSVIKGRPELLVNLDLESICKVINSTTASTLNVKSKHESPNLMFVRSLTLERESILVNGWVRKSITPLGNSDTQGGESSERPHSCKEESYAQDCSGGAEVPSQHTPNGNWIKFQYQF